MMRSLRELRDEMLAVARGEQVVPPVPLRPGRVIDARGQSANAASTNQIKLDHVTSFSDPYSSQP